ncbi:MAG: hypothetical protein R3A13_02055 [Bdellovibrionota bacterium]
MVAYQGNNQTIDSLRIDNDLLKLRSKRFGAVVKNSSFPCLRGGQPVLIARNGTSLLTFVLNAFERYGQNIGVGLKVIAKSRSRVIVLSNVHRLREGGNTQHDSVALYIWQRNQAGRKGSKVWNSPITVAGAASVRDALVLLSKQSRIKDERLKTDPSPKLRSRDLDWSFI